MLNERNTLLEDDGIEEEILVEEECSVAQAVWGDILGNIENQTDLQNALDAKQDSLTEAQLNAVNSGITSEKVATYDGYADQIASKADQSALNAESIARGEADTALGTRIDNEALARQQADNGLQSQIDAITSKSDVVDVVANYAALQAYDTSTLGNNDVVKVLDDETHEDALTYYRWSTTTQTWSYIGQEAPYYSKGQMDVKLAEKQDKLTAGANIQIQNGTISATDTTYTAGNGLNLNGTEFSADTDILATKEDLEDYYTKPETDNLLAPKLEAEVVTELPTTGTEGKLYLTPKAHTTQTATGNPITATITDDAGQMESFQLDGDTFQQTYTGKNLLNLSASRDFTSGTDYSFDASSGVLTLTMSSAPAVNRYSGWCLTGITAGAKYTFSIESFTNSALPNTDRAIMIRSHNGTSATELATLNKTQTSYTFTAPNDSVRLDFFFYIASGDTDSTSIITKPMLEAGETATTYEPFVGGQPSPSPDYPQPIQTVTGEQTVTVSSKNLFSGQNLTEDSRVSTSNGGTYGREGYDVSDYIKIEPSTNYALTCGNAQNGSYFSWYDSTKTYISGSSWQNKTVKTSPANASYIRFDFLASEVGIVQFEKGSVSSYVPYSNVSYPLDLGSIELCKLGDYQDYIWKDGEDWKVRKEVGKVILDGVDKPFSGRYTTASSHYRFIYTDQSIPNYTSGTVAQIYCDRLIGGTIGNTYSRVERIAYNDASNRLVLYISSIEDSTLKAANTWLESNPITVYYILSTPTDTEITNEALIAQLEAIRTASLQNGTNTITNTATGSNLAGDMEIGYYGFNPRNRYDKWLWLDLNNNYEQIGS